ncbi:SGNH/GDSL hydrolase family protein [Cytophaga aurantiaca]|uniref:SGNH/GDSL hydrolase family protein n=1 Tax=Cytophaga aurantiaca TaxID=29530 RepID=UPI0012FB14D6|nr:SGNH/GDSL hydrolase family protein [Cytophaga aurantiaca]
MKSVYYFLSIPVIVLLCTAMAYRYCSSEEKKFIMFSGRNHYVYGRYEYKDDYVSFSNSGSSITFGTSTPDVSVLIESLSEPTNPNLNWLLVLVNDSCHTKFSLKPGKHSYALDLPSTKSNTWTITLVKITESHIGRVNCYGFEIPEKESGMEFRPMVTYWGKEYYDKNTIIQFIGNSITCGYGNMLSIAPPPNGTPLTGFHSENENAYMSYAMQTARNLRAIPMLVSFSGKGMYRNFDSDTNETMPKIYDRIHLQDSVSAIWEGDPVRETATSLIVINLGTNDYFGESRNEHLNDAVFVKTYIKFVSKIINLYPDSKIICVNGPMLNNNFPAGKKCWTRIQASIIKVQEHFYAMGDKRVYTFFFTPQSAPYGEDYHPSLATHTKMAEELTTFIRTVVYKK